MVLPRSPGYYDGMFKTVGEPNVLTDRSLRFPGAMRQRAGCLKYLPRQTLRYA